MYMYIYIYIYYIYIYIYIYICLRYIKHILTSTYQQDIYRFHINTYCNTEIHNVRVHT